jgi:hypothetical protein
VEAIEDGVHYVSWGDPRRSRPSGRDKPQRFYVQTFDKRSYRIAPEGADGRFAEPVAALSIDAAYRLVHGDGVRLQISVYSYEKGGGFIEEKAEAAATSSQDRVAVHIDLSSATGLVAYKLRTRVIPTRKRGGLQFYPPVVRTSAVR